MPPSGGRFCSGADASSGSLSPWGKNPNCRAFPAFAQTGIDEGVNLRSVCGEPHRIAFEQRLDDQAAQHADDDIRHLRAIDACTQFAATLRLSEMAAKAVMEAGA